MTTSKEIKALRTKIIRTLKEMGMMTRSELSILLNLPLTTVWDHLKFLHSESIIEKRKIPDGSTGRPKTYWRLKKIPEF